MKTSSRTLAPALALSALFAVVTSVQPAAAQVKQTVEKEGQLRYLRYLPPGHEARYRWPVIVFLHGGGEIGTDITKLLGHSLPALVEQDDWNWPFIVVSPQLDQGKWYERAADIGTLLDRIEKDYGGDPNRLYLTGLSWGGIGSFDLGVLLAKRWAALMPLCSNAANGTPWDQHASIATKPMFVVHGTADINVPYQGDVDRVAQLEALGATFYRFDYALADTDKDVIPQEVMQHNQVFGTFIGYDHGVWNPVYGRVGGTKKTVQYQWLLEHSLDGTPFVDPKLVPPVDPNAGGSGGQAGSGGVTGTAGTSGIGGVGGIGGMGMAGTNAGGGASDGMPSLAGAPTLPAGGSSPAQATAANDSGCQLGYGGRSSSGGLVTLLALLLAGASRTARFAPLRRRA